MLAQTNRRSPRLCSLRGEALQGWPAPALTLRCVGRPLGGEINGDRTGSAACHRHRQRPHRSEQVATAPDVTRRRIDVSLLQRSATTTVVARQRRDWSHRRMMFRMTRYAIARTSPSRPAALSARYVPPDPGLNRSMNSIHWSGSPTRKGSRISHSTSPTGPRFAGTRRAHATRLPLSFGPTGTSVTGSVLSLASRDRARRYASGGIPGRMFKEVW